MDRYKLIVLAFKGASKTKHSCSNYNQEKQLVLGTNVNGTCVIITPTDGLKTTRLKVFRIEHFATFPDLNICKYSQTTKQSVNATV